MKVYAPGKLILSGEHAVVYGSPAIAMAVNRYAIATVTPERSDHFAFHLADLAHNSRLSLAALQTLKDKIKRKYQRFIRGEYTIRQVLHKPFELAQVALGIVAESLNLASPPGMKVQVTSDIPIGCGMGSSAATILCVMQALSAHMQTPLTKDALYGLALQAENIQHGRSSGLDLRIALTGGCLYVHGNEVQSRPMPPMPLYLVNTGTPLSTTGQCVEAVATRFQTTTIADEFASVTNQMDVALQAQDRDAFCAAITANHALLVRIGVVPQRVQNFIERIPGVAKVCGAGAVSGEQAGVVLVIPDNDDVSDLVNLCDEFGYSWMTIAGETRGVYVE
jgi:mevalonate kinase